MADFQLYTYIRQWDEGKKSPDVNVRAVRVAHQPEESIPVKLVDGDEVRRYDSSHKYKASRSSIPASWGVGLHIVEDGRRIALRQVFSCRRIHPVSSIAYPSSGRSWTVFCPQI